MKKHESFWYKFLDFINHYFCFEMLQNEKTVKLDDVSYIDSSQDYDLKFHQTNHDFTYTMNPMYRHGKPA